MTAATPSRFVFIGDSVTDAGRTSASAAERSVDLGNGYVSLVAATLGDTTSAITVTNRGINGHRTVDLAARWQTDVINLRPTLVSILIGINDTWRRYDSHDPTSSESFEQTYRTILERTVEHTNARIVLCEPFLLAVKRRQRTWREDLDPKIAVVRRLAVEFDAVFVPFDQNFAEAATTKKPKHWAADGVHPTAAGHQLMAELWISHAMPGANESPSSPLR